MLRLKIGQKLLILLLLVSLGPVIAVNVLFLRIVQAQLKQAASDRQSLLVQNSVERVDSFIGEKITALIIHSQTSAIQQLSLSAADQELQQLVKQDSSISRVTLVDPKGVQLMAVDRTGDVAVANDAGVSEAFKAATFLGGKEYIGAVTYDINHKPQVIIAIPNLTFTARQRLLALSTSESGVIRSADDIKGALVVTVSLSDLWNSVLSNKLGSNGYAYVVDDKGNIIAYPNQSIGNPKDVKDAGEIALLLKEQTGVLGHQDTSAHITVSENGVAVLSSHRLVPRTGWAVVAEEPTASVYGDISRLSKVDIILSSLAALIAIVLSLLFSRSLLKPIRELQTGATRIGSGDLNYKLPVSSRDELGTLARTFNDMAASLAVFVERFKSENLRLEAERTKLQAVLNSISEGVVAINAAGQVVLANSIASQIIHPNSRLDITGSVLSTLLRLTDVKGDTVQLDLPIQGLASYTDLTMQGANGEEPRYFNVLAARIVGDTSGIEGLITLRDITKDRELEVLKLDFVSIAAHELRTPLTSIRGYLQFLGETKTALSSEDHSNLDRATAAAANLAGLVTNLLNVSKIERGSLALTESPVDLARLISEVTKDNQLAAANKKLALVYDGPSSDTWVLGDDPSLREVINNLLSNAIMYTDSGSITVRCQVDSAAANVSVSDTGRGIPAAAMDKLFTKFYRVQGRLETGSQGSGLGLYISKNIIERHHGSITVDSQEGSGTTFSFSLPITAKSAIMVDETNVGKNRAWTTKRIAR